jgi:alcohol dehydrogenase
MERVLTDAHDMEARGMMLLGAAFAGVAIENSMLGAAHAAANPLTAKFGIVHGQAVGVMLPAVVRFNAELPEAQARYAELAALGGFKSVEALVARLDEILDLAAMRDAVRQLEISPSDFSALTAGAAQQWTAQFNPRPVTDADFAQLYAEALR